MKHQKFDKEKKQWRQWDIHTISGIWVDHAIGIDGLSLNRRRELSHAEQNECFSHKRLRWCGELFTSIRDRSRHARVRVRPLLLDIPVRAVLVPVHRYLYIGTPVTQTLEGPFLALSKAIFCNERLIFGRFVELYADVFS